MERLILARHGESTYSLSGLVNGDDSIDVPLTAAGAEQARALGQRLAVEQIDLCVVSTLPRTRATADHALAGRPVPIESWAVLNDPRYGSFEGGLLDDYRAWARASPSSREAPGGGESRAAIVSRYLMGFRRLLDRPEATVLAVLHALPIAYLVDAVDGTPPTPRVTRLVGYAEPATLDRASVAGALAVLQAWLDTPTW